MFDNLFNNFHQVHPLLRSAKILNEDERKEYFKYYENANAHLHKIKSNDFLVKELGAQLGDILCLIRKNEYIYRLVVD